MIYFTYLSFFFFLILLIYCDDHQFLFTQRVSGCTIYFNVTRGVAMLCEILCLLFSVCLKLPFAKFFACIAPTLYFLTQNTAGENRSCMHITLCNCILIEIVVCWRTSWVKKNLGQAFCHCNISEAKEAIWLHYCISTKITISYNYYSRPQKILNI
jgi:hypothetical protein